MSAQPPPPPAAEGPAARRRGRAVVRGTALAAAAALVALLLVPQLRWMHPLCSSSITGGMQPQRTAVLLAAGGRGSGGDAAAQHPQPLQQVSLPKGFRFKKVAAIIAFDRFEYFRRVVDGLRQAWGSEEYIVTITIDGPPTDEDAAEGGGGSSSSYNREGRQAILAYTRHLQWLSRNRRGHFRDVIINASDANLGVWPNKKRAVAGAMALSDYAVILEDDIVLERDALRWFEWHVTSGLAFERPEIAVATCWSSSFPYHASAVEGHDLLVAREMGLLDKYWVDHWAQPWGWAIWRRTWDAVGEGWTGQDIKLARAIQAQGWFETMPLVARCNNIGAVGAHKKGQSVGHIHQRALTSASFPNLAACGYRELPRRNTSAPLDREPLYQQVVRKGILQDTKFSTKSMEEHRQALLRYMEQHPEPSGWKSSC